MSPGVEREGMEMPKCPAPGDQSVLQELHPDAKVNDAS